MEAQDVSNLDYAAVGWGLFHKLEYIIGELGEALALFGAHRQSCETQYGEECSCGYTLALQTAIAFRSKDQAEEVDEEAEGTSHSQRLSDTEAL